MKKILLAGTVVVALGAGAYSVYADEVDTKEYEDSYEYTEDYGPRHYEKDSDFNSNQNFTGEERQAERSDYHEERIESALEDGRITEDEAAQRRKDLEQNNQYDEENGFFNRGQHHGRRNRSGHHGYNRGQKNNRNRSGYCGY